MSSHSGELEAIDRILNRGGDADDVLRAVLDVFGSRFSYVAIAFVEDGELVVGPEQGHPQETRSFPIEFQGSNVAELRVAGAEPGDDAFLNRVGLLISPHCLVGWDTGGKEWRP